MMAKYRWHPWGGHWRIQYGRCPCRTAHLDYTALDPPDTPVRLRLNSTVTAVDQKGAAGGSGPDPAASDQVIVAFVQNGKLHRVNAKNCILACYHAMIPALCPALPADQKEALAMQVKVPSLYNSVAVRNWQAWKNLGVGAMCARSSAPC